MLRKRNERNYKTKRISSIELTPKHCWLVRAVVSTKSLPLANADWSGQLAALPQTPPPGDAMLGKKEMW